MTEPIRIDCPECHGEGHGHRFEGYGVEPMVSEVRCGTCRGTGHLPGCPKCRSILRPDDSCPGCGWQAEHPEPDPPRDPDAPLPF